MSKAERHRLNAWEAAEQQNWELAVKEINAALDLKPTEPLYWVLKGRFLRESGAFEEAETILKKALNVSTANKHAWTELGHLYMAKQSFEKAAFCFQKAAAIEPDFCVYTLLANSELPFDPNAALEHAHAALALKPDWEEAVRIAHAAQQIIAGGE